MLAADKSALFASLRRTGDVSPLALDALAAIATTRSFAKGAWLLRGGERATHCFFLAEGLVRELYIGDAGEEHTRSFLAEGSVTGSLLDLLSGEPSVTWIQALESTRALAWSYRDFDALCARFSDLQALARRTAEALYVRKARREHEMLALDAAARYARWRDESAHLDARISRRQVASYLGVTPEHLSRLSAGARRTPPRRARAPRRSK